MRGWNQEIAAQKLDMSPFQYSRIESGLFARPPAGFENAAKRVFGKDWTFEELMKAPPEPNPGNGGEM